jgi:hypothetical protein
MKRSTKIEIALILALALTGSLWAWDNGPGSGPRGTPGWGPGPAYGWCGPGYGGPGYGPERFRGRHSPRDFENWDKLTVSGKLEAVHGRIALKDSGKTYYIVGISQLVGFVDGLQEGAKVSLEGWTRAFPGDSNSLVLRATKLTFNGKDYDLDRD